MDLFVAFVDACSMMQPLASSSLEGHSLSDRPVPEPMENNPLPPGADEPLESAIDNPRSSLASTDSITPKYVKVIEPPTGWPSLNLVELWNYRDLLFMLIWRDISANYRQSVIGYGWVLFKSVKSLSDRWFSASSQA
jgi:hypothetical protein